MDHRADSGSFFQLAITKMMHAREQQFHIMTESNFFVLIIYFPSVTPLKFEFKRVTRPKFANVTTKCPYSAHMTHPALVLYIASILIQCSRRLTLHFLRFGAKRRDQKHPGERRTLARGCIAGEKESVAIIASVCGCALCTPAYLPFAIFYYCRVRRTTPVLRATGSRLFFHPARAREAA